jgi:DNA-binding NarL/FixJ family response regulator
MTTVFITDDHPVVRQGIADLLSDEPDFVIVGEAANGEDLLREAGRLQPDVALVDVQLPGIDGYQACEQLRRRHPRIRVVILTTHTHERAMLAAFTAGARGFAVKSSSPEVIRQAVRSVAAGGTFVDPNVAHRLVALATKGRGANGPHNLTPAEMRVLELLPQGRRNREIAEALGVGEETVKTHVSHVLAKLGASDRAQAAAIAMREGLA